LSLRFCHSADTANIRYGSCAGSSPKVTSRSHQNRRILQRCNPKSSTSAKSYGDQRKPPKPSDDQKATAKSRVHQLSSMATRSPRNRATIRSYNQKSSTSAKSYGDQRKHPKPSDNPELQPKVEYISLSHHGGNNLTPFLSFIM